MKYWISAFPTSVLESAVLQGVQAIHMHRKSELSLETLYPTLQPLPGNKYPDFMLIAFFFFFGHWKFPGQGSNPSDNTKFLTARLPGNY